MIRVAMESDADEIAAIYNYYIQNSVATFEEEFIDAKEINNRIDRDKREGLPWLVAKDAEGIIGYAYATTWNKRIAYRYTAETTVYISNHHLNKGWGTKLYLAILSELRTLNIHTVIGGITLPNEASVALHEKLGMQKVAHFKEVGFKFNKWLDVGYWQMELNA